MRTFVHLQSRLFGHFCWLLALLLCSLTTLAQDKPINGKVTDAKKQPLPGVSVQVKGTSRGTATDGEGAFKIAAKNGDVLIVSFIGYVMQEVPVTNQANLNITLNEDVKQLEGVVVTALGIKRSQMALGYATQKVSEKQMTDARSNNWSSALSGKVAGLTLNSPGGPMGSTRINLRGDRSLNGKNDALIVVDGVPLSSGLVSSGADNAYQAGEGADVPVDFGNGIADINPDDIESITVLKGAGATALYGSRAGNGALIITTKSGSRKGKGLGVTVNTNFSMNDVLRWPDFQYEYGQGVGKTFTPAADLYYSYGNSADGANTGSTSSAFGPKFNGQNFFQYDPATGAQSLERQPWVPYKNNVKDFWRTGYTLTNSVSMEGGNDKGSARASFTHTKNEWIMPNTGFERMTAALSANYSVSEKLKLSSKVSFTNKRSDNLPSTGYNNQSMSYYMIFQNPNVDLGWYRPIWKPGKEQVDQIHPFSSYIDNPYLIAYEMTNSVNSNNVVGNLTATYSINKNWDVMVRTGLTMANEAREQRRPYSTANFAKGYYKEQQLQNYEINSDALITYRTDLTPKIKMSASAGGNLRTARASTANAYVNGLATPGIYKLSNGLYSVMYKGIHANKNVNSVYALANFSYDEKIFVDVTGRNDWSSTLPKSNWSFFYPSINGSFILNRIFELPQEISYAKVRVSAAQVGIDAEPYQTLKYFTQHEFPASATVSSVLYNDKFKPEISTSYEAGLEGQFFGNRIGFDMSLYRTFTKNQILSMPLDPSTGYSKGIVNGGNIRNQGVEVVLNGKPVAKQDFNWNTTVTWSMNRSKVISLAEELGTGDQQLIGTGGNASIIAKVGGRMGDIYGYGFLRSPDGQIVYTKDGLPARPAEIQYIGNAYADWKGGINNEFTYKNYRFSFLIDGSFGGKIYSQSHHKMMEQGKLKASIPGRDEGFIIGQGVVQNADGSYSANTKKVTVGEYYGDYYRRANVEANLLDASYLKLREVRLEYTFPKSWTNRAKLNQLSVALYGRDLFMISDFPIFDPETASLNGGTILPGIEMGQLPSMRTFGLNVTLKL